MSTGKPISCCRSDGNTLSPRYVHPDCSVIMVPDRDPIYGQHYVRCMNYVRSLPVLKAECTFGPAEQVYLTFFITNLVIFINLRWKKKKERTVFWIELLELIRIIIFFFRQQMNQASHFLDGSAIYGSTLKKSRQLREFEGGRLRVHKMNNHEFLPIGEDEISSACAKNCYNSGKWILICNKNRYWHSSKDNILKYRLSFISFVNDDLNIN